jgi:hypothetical protein
MGRDSKREFRIIKPNYRQIKITFHDGHTMRVPVCNSCVVNPSYSGIMDTLFREGSIAFSNDVKKKQLKDRADKSITNHSIVEVLVPQNTMTQRREAEYGSRS